MELNLKSEANVFGDNAAMHAKYGVHDAVRNMSVDKMNAHLKFRLDFILEELTETYRAAGYVLMSNVQQVDVPANLGPADAEEVVDGLIDTIVVAAGTLDVLDIDSARAWNEVHAANMDKEVGIKASRPNPLNLPDLIKGPTWQAPSHAGNHGLLTEMFGNGSGK